MDLIEEYCKSRREVSIEELFNQWELRTGTHRQAEPLNIAYSSMVRVDKIDLFLTNRLLLMNWELTRF